MRLRTFARELTVFAVTVLASVMLCAPALAQTQAPRTVLTIYQNAEDFPGTARFDAAMQNALAQAAVPINYFAEYLETEEFPKETASVALRDYILRKYEGRHVDLVIAAASGALQFALRYRAELFPGAPIVFIAVTVPEEVINRGVSGITGVLSDTPFSETVELALNLHPSTKQVFVVAQSPAEGYEERVRSELSRFSNRVRLAYIEDRTVPTLLAAVKAVPPGSVILYTRSTLKEAGRVVYPDEMARLIAEASRAPIYTAADLYMGSGVVGGMVRSPETSGTRLGQIARQVLDGRPPDSIAMRPMETTPIFDWRQVKRWGIDPAKLPAGSRILFRAPTAWETYRWYIVGTIVVVTAQLLLITGLLTQRGRRRRAERIVCAREASLRTSYDRIRLLAGQLINAQEAARAGLAQDLHDDICQRLAMMTTSIDLFRNSSGSIKDVNTQRFFASLARDTRATFETVRRLSHDLHPATLRVLGLVPAIKTHCIEVANRHNVEVTFTPEGDLRHLPDDIAVCFFRIAQESLRNGIEHGAARRLTVSLRRCGSDIEMTVTDDGKGFSLDAASRDGSGVGVISMEERAHAIGGTLYIISGTERGTTIRIKAPLRPAQGEILPDEVRRTDSAAVVS
jgi:signal transduction histidine kinase